MASPPTRKKVTISESEVSSIYYSSKTMSAASRELSAKYGLTSRAWRYRLGKYERTGILNRSQIGKGWAVTEKPARPAGNEVMLTVHFKIKYNKIGGKGAHPLHLEGFYSLIVPRNFGSDVIQGMMSHVYNELTSLEYNRGELLDEYLKVNNQDYENGVEVEELSATNKRDGQFEAEVSRSF